MLLLPRRSLFFLRIFGAQGHGTGISSGMSRWIQYFGRRVRHTRIAEPTCHFFSFFSFFSLLYAKGEEAIVLD